MHRGSRPRRLLGARGRAGLASTVGPVLVGVIFAFAWNMAGSHGAATPQPGPGLAPTVGTAVDQAADQAWASVMPTATRLPDRYVSTPRRIRRGEEDGLSAVCSDHSVVGPPQVRSLRQVDRSGPGQGEAGAKICRTCPWLTGTRKPTG